MRIIQLLSCTCLRQVNLTRFSLFFPEKREFFLNDADLFEFGRISAAGNDATSASTEDDVFRSELLDLSVKVSYTFRF